MYLNIKSPNLEKYFNFYEQVNGRKSKFDNSKIIFDNLIFENVKITFYSNLSILFKGIINNELEKKIDLLIDQELYVGSDEVGIGEKIGPIIVVALEFKSLFDKKKIILSGIKDSKKFNASEIKKKAELIKKHSNFHIIKVEPNEFNKIYKKNPNTKAINAILQNELHKKFDVNKKHIIDQFVNEKKYNEYLTKSKNEIFNGKIIFETKSEDKYVEVAAAAILAKNFFNNWIIDFLNKNENNFEIIGKKLNSWQIYLDVINKKIKVNDINNFVKNWNKN